MASNKYGPKKSTGPIIDPNSPQAMEMLGEDPNAFPTPQPTDLGKATEKLESAKAEASGPLVVRPEASPEENMEAVRNNASRVRSAEDQVAEGSTAYQLSPQEDMALDAGPPSQGEVWRGAARYSGGDAPKIIRTPDGNMWLKSGGYISPIKDEREASMFVNMDREQARIQEVRRRSRIQEMELQESLEVMDGESETFAAYNNHIVKNRLAEYSGGSQRKTQEELDILQGIYGDSELMDRLMKLPPAQFTQTLDGMEQLLMQGGSMAQVIGLARSADTQNASRRRSAQGTATATLDRNMEIAAGEVDAAQADVERLELEIAKLKDEAASSIDGGETNAHTIKVLEDQARSARLRVGTANADFVRARNSKAALQSRAGATWSSGGRNLDQILDIPSRASEHTQPGGTLWCVMDSVAKSNGYNGLDDENLKAMLNASPEAVGQFVRECQGYAKTVGGWQTSDDNTMPWVEGIYRHSLNHMNPDHLSAAVQSVLKTTVGPGADMPEMPTVQDRMSQADTSQKIIPSIIQSLSSGPVRDKLSTGTRSAEGTPEYEAERNEIYALASQLGDPKEQDRLLKEYRALPSEAPPSPLEGRVDQSMFEVRGDSEFMAEFKSVLEESLPTSLFMFAMNKDGVFDQKRSDQAFEQVKSRAFELGLKIDADRAAEGLPSVAGREKIERAIELLESERSRPASADPLADENILLDALGAAGGAIEDTVMGAARSVGGSGSNYQMLIESLSKMGQ